MVFTKLNDVNMSEAINNESKNKVFVCLVYYKSKNCFKRNKKQKTHL